MTSVVAAASCGAIVIATEPLTIPLLRRAAAIDVPGPRSSHIVPTPRGGGAPIAVGLLVAAALIHLTIALAFAIAVGAFGVIGLTEDLRGLAISTRLILQTVGSVVVADLLVRRLGAPEPMLVVWVAAVAVWIVGFVNAFNFMDGVNGISGAHALIGGLAYAWLGLWQPNEFLVAAGAAVAASALAFLPWNVPRARVFLGDVGSYGLGSALAVLAAYAFLHGIPVEAAVAPLALYLTDTSWTLLRRIRARQRWHDHRAHIYQRWCDLGWSHQRVTAVTATGTILLIMLGTGSLMGSHEVRILADTGGVGVLATYLLSPALLSVPKTQPELS